MIESIGRLPEVGASDSSRYLTRSCVIEEKNRLRLCRQDSSGEYRAARTNPEKGKAFESIQSCLEDEARLEVVLEEQYLPIHSSGQFINPRCLFLSPLFRVRSSAVPREKEISFTLWEVAGKERLEYVGPELRQSDALVFMALLNMLRDLKVGVTASFHPDEMCRALYGRYDGPARKKLRETIYRLQRALLKFKDHSVQLVLKFLYPSKGVWSVALDESIVRVFKYSDTVWLNLGTRLQLSEGLATWLYGYVESQSRLIPTKLSDLHKLCGSEANEVVFQKKMRRALADLSAHGVIQKEWGMRAGVLRWAKAV